MRRHIELIVIMVVSFGVAQVIKLTGNVSSWLYAWLAIGTCWLFIPGLLDQARRNNLSGRAAQQLSWNAQLALIMENLAWIALACATRDWVIYIACLPGLFLGQYVFVQMLYSSEKSLAEAEIWMVALLVISIVAVIGGPSFLQQKHIDKLSCLATAATFWCIGGYVIQFCKNTRSRQLTVRDFSTGMSVAFARSAAAWMLYEYMDGKTGWPMYVTMSSILVLHLGLIAQLRYYQLLGSWARGG